AWSKSIPDAHRQEHAQFLQVAGLLQHVAPGIGPLNAHAGVKQAAVARHFELAAQAHVDLAHDVVEMAELVEVDAARAPAAAAVEGQAPLAAVAVGGLPRVPFAAKAEADEGAVGVMDGKRRSTAGALENNLVGGDAVQRERDGELRVRLPAAFFA